MEAVLKAQAPREGAPGFLSTFYGSVLPEQGMYALFEGPRKRHVWCRRLDELTQQTESRSDQVDLYFATASFKDSSERTIANALYRRAFCFDIDAGAAKVAKHGDKVYATRSDAKRALFSWCKATGLVPAWVIGSGAGLHIYFVLDQDTPIAEWLPVVHALKAKAIAEGLKIDAGPTANAALVLRPIGSLHNNGTRVEVLSHLPAAVYPLAQVASLVSSHAVAGPTLTKGKPATALRPLNAEAVGDTFADRPPASFTKIVAGCAAMAQATKDNGAGVAEPLWRAMLGISKHCADPDKRAHDASKGHADYDPVETQAKLDSYAAGPTTCAHFEDHAPEACAGCEHRGKIKSPFLLGCTVSTVGAIAEAADAPFSDPGSALTGSTNGAPNTLPGPAWVVKMNERYAVVRWGAGIAILDKLTPYVSAGGIRYALGFLDIAAFQQLLRGAFELVNGKLTPTAVAWLSHPQRRQYGAAVFAPGEDMPPDVLNLWSGYAVQAAQGDVAPWLELLEHLIPDLLTRRYVLLWLALKVQKPGNVQRTILIFTGSKGTGKNSLFEPLVRLFGAAGRVFDDAEQVAGRFTGHLMTVAFAVLDEALFAGDPRQADRVKARVTATSMTYEAKGRDPVTGVNRCAYVSLSNHTHVWQATIDERRAVVVETGSTLIGNREFWTRYYAWLDGAGPAALLDYLQRLDLTGFDVGLIPRTEALRRQVEHTALRNPTVAWWFAVLDEGAINLRDGSARRRHDLAPDASTVIDKDVVRVAFEEASGTKKEWPNAMKQLRGWTGGLREVRPRAEGGGRGRAVEFPSLAEMRAAFSTATGIQFEPEASA